MNYMTKLGFFVLVLVFNFTGLFAQESYKIGNTIWKYNKPTNYITRVNNFEETRKRADDYFEEHDEINVSTAREEKILFSFAVTESAKTNAIIASYQSDSNIQKYTLKGYVDVLAEFLKHNPSVEDPTILVSVDIKEQIIDGKKFYLVIKTVDYTEHNFSYTMVYYVTHIDGVEFSISVIYDNEEDKLKIEKSILESTFE